jgi:DNA-binding transcriptional LysR family regulator
MQHIDWRDLRIVLALARHGTLSEAGRALRLDATTVSRRITALEEQIGTLFTRDPDGWRPTEAGRRVMDAASRMSEEVRSLSRDLDAASERAEGIVRLTTLDYVAGWFLAPRVAELLQRHPGLTLDLRCTEQVLDLVAGQADVALRLNRPTEAGLRVRRLAEVPLGVYAATSWLTRRDPATDAELVVLGPPDSRLPEIRWLRQRFPSARVVAATNSVPTAYQLVAGGVGIGVMTVEAARGHDGLVRLDTDGPTMEREIWRVVPESIAHTPRIRAVCDWLDVTAAEVAT